MNLQFGPITQQQLESYLWGAATRLRGAPDVGDYKAYIFSLLFFKRLSDVYDEEMEKALRDYGDGGEFVDFAENHRFKVPEGAHWDDVRGTATNLGEAIRDAMYAIEHANQDRLVGIFGDAPWTNKERLPDATLRELIEHFSTLTLSLANVPEDEFGRAYEYLIKKFADDSGHTAAEFYTNRTVVRLMARMLRPEPGESIYDPTCGTGGMLLIAADEMRRQGKEHRTLRLYGQERNLMTSAIARMNLFLHGIEEFEIARGDTLAEPRFLEGDELRRFDMVLANPPYSIKQWDRKAWATDRYGRNVYGVPPQGRADYAFFQHILASLAAGSGRCAILFPHGVLFREEERAMRSAIVAADAIEAVIGLGPNLFYNSPMEACVVVCRACKPEARRGRVLLIDAKGEVTRERSQSFLEPEHIARVVDAYDRFTDEPGFATVATLAEIAANNGNLSIPLYVRPAAGENGAGDGGADLATTLREWEESGATLRASMDGLFATLKEAGIDG
ncbi:MAG: N-6 DNA methylase [Dehalococcoidia bacterium]